MQTSLVDLAKSMGLSNGENAPKPTSLVDFARQEAAKPMSLLDVARQEAAKPVVEAPRSGGISLQSLAQEINEEERSRLQSAVAVTAAEVQQESIAQRKSTLMSAAAEIAQEEAQAAQVLLVAKKQADATQKPSVAAIRAAPVPIAKEPPPVQANAQEDAGYSSYEDYEDDDDEPNSKKSSKKEEEPETDKEEPPEKTTTNDSPECKLLLRAVFKADMRTVRDLLATDEEAAAFADQHGWSGLHWAASQGHKEILDVLLQHGAPLNAVDHINGWTPLHVAVIRANLPCAQRLLRAGASVNIRDLYGDSALDCAKAVRGKPKQRLLQLLTSRFVAS